MNVLLVDDDRFVVAALEKKINWEQLTVTEVLNCFQYPSSSENHRKKLHRYLCLRYSKCPAVLVLIFFPGSGNQERNTIYFPDQLCGF